MYNHPRGKPQRNCGQITVAQIRQGKGAQGLQLQLWGRRNLLPRILISGM